MPTELNPEQLRQAIEIMHAYLAAPPTADGLTLAETGSQLDRKRVSVIENELKPMISSFLANQVALAEFKTKVDGINKRNELWGFKGVKGQMFLNMILNVAG